VHPPVLDLVLQPAPYRRAHREDEQRGHDDERDDARDRAEATRNQTSFL